MSAVIIPSNWKVSRVSGIGKAMVIDRDSGGYSVVRRRNGRWAITDGSEYFLRGSLGRLRTFSSLQSAIRVAEQTAAESPSLSGNNEGGA